METDPKHVPFKDCCVVSQNNNYYSETVLMLPQMAVMLISICSKWYNGVSQTAVFWDTVMATCVARTELSTIAHTQNAHGTPRRRY